MPLRVQAAPARNVPDAGPALLCNRYALTPLSRTFRNTMNIRSCSPSQVLYTDSRTPDVDAEQSSAQVHGRVRRSYSDMKFD